LKGIDMIKNIKGLHRVTSMASDTRQNNRFFTDTLGLHRVKQTVNFDDPGVYHLYYDVETGSAGTIMTHFPFQNLMLGRRPIVAIGLQAIPLASYAALGQIIALMRRRNPIRSRRCRYKSEAKTIHMRLVDQRVASSNPFTAWGNGEASKNNLGTAEWARPMHAPG
jgi:catechol 2,3-dioxygenase-like lactoylglutathione lyase family enzyme